MCYYILRIFEHRNDQKTNGALAVRLVSLASKQFNNFLARVWISFKDFQAVEPGLPGGKNAQVLECGDF